MAKDLEDALRDILSDALRDAAEVIDEGDKRGRDLSLRNGSRRSSGPLSGMRGVAVGAALGALATVAVKSGRRTITTKLAKRAAASVAKKVAPW